MNTFLPSRYDERIARLALGIEPVDAVRGGRIASLLAVMDDRVPLVPKRLPDDLYGLTEAGSDDIRRVPRRHSCRFVVHQREDLDPKIALRFNDTSRKYVPRRIHYTVPANAEERRFRVRRPVFFPAAAYDIDETATGLRGRVTWTVANNAPPVRWARIEATIGGARVGYAHGDDRGEFLLLLASRAGGLGDLPVPLRARITVFAPPQMPARGRDILGDLPIEVHAVPSAPDLVSPGTSLPSIEINGVMRNYAATALSSRDVTFQLGRLRTDEPKFFMA